MRRSTTLVAAIATCTLSVSAVAYASPLLFQEQNNDAVIESAAQHDKALAARSIELTSVKKPTAEELKAEDAAEQERLARAAELNAKQKMEAQIRKSKRLKPKQLAHLLTMVGFEGEAHRLAWGIVMRESTGRPKAHNDNPATGDDSYGLFQINMYGSLGPSRVDKFDLDKESDLFDPVVNAQVAYYMSNKGRDFGAWGFGPNAYKNVSLSSLERHMHKYPGE